MLPFINLFKLLQITRAQPQYGYVISGMRQDDLSNLAEHHYLVTFIAWMLASHLKDKGAKIDVLKTVEFAMVHDLGELFGSDIALPYAVVNPKARTYAKLFEQENAAFLSQFFGSQKKKYLQLSTEIMDVESDEGIIAKIADYMECSHFKQYMRMYSAADGDMVIASLQEKVKKLHDTIAKKELTTFLKLWKKEIQKGSNLEIILKTMAKKNP